MSLYSEWLEYAQTERREDERTAFWNNYFSAEKDNYQKILQRRNDPFKGRLCELASGFNMDEKTFVGFIDGANTSFANGEFDLETLTSDSELELVFDLEKLYFNMLDAKADWLYNLPEWDEILTPEKRAEILKEQRRSGVFHAEQTVGRNDPCPCGSGKKYKKCCGANK